MRRTHKADAFHVELLEFRRLLSFSVGGDSALNGYPNSVAAADFNGDGRADLATMAYPDGVAVAVMLGNSNGTFTAGQPLQAWPGTSVDAGDVNGDGKADLVTTVVPFSTGGSTPWLQVFAGNGDGTFRPRQFVDLPAPPNPPTPNYTYYALTVKIADVDADGGADLVALCQYEWPDPNWDPDSPYPPQTFYGNYLAVLRGNGNTAFTPAFVRDTSAATDVEARDLNRDGELDLVLARATVLEILLGAGDGTFSAGPSYFWANAIPETDTAIALADFNGDGNIDLAAAGNQLYVALGDGNGAFATPVGYPAGPSRSRSLAAADFNSDGRPDVVAGNIGTVAASGYVDGNVSVLLNDGGRGFRAPLVLPCGPGDGYAQPLVAAADFNGDGRPDVAAAGYFQRFLDLPLANVRLLVNDGQWPAPPPEPVGPEFLVHAPSAEYQNYPDVAADAAGNFVVVWNSQSGAVGDPYQVFARRFSAGGQPLGDEFLVSQADGRYYTTPAIAMDPEGDFVVAWRSRGSIVARLFDAAGRPRGAEFPVNSAAGGENPDVAMDADGDFVVAWQSEYRDGSQFGIYARRYTAAGTPLGDDFRVNTFTQYSQEDPTVAMDPAGNVVVAWMSSLQADSPFDIYAQMYDAAGARRGEEFRVNTITAGQQDYPSAAMDAAGNFVVTWDSWVPDDWSRVYARRYDSAGLPRSAESRVGTSATGHELRPSAAIGTGGELTVAWSLMDGFTSPARMYARNFNASGADDTAPLLINPTVEGAGPIAAGPDGGFVATWWHQYSGGQGIDDDVYARVFSAAVTPTPSAVLARHVFYNHSAFDGNDAAATAADDAAVATDKAALLPGQSPTFANVTSYAKGINGVMVDVAGLPAGAVLSAADFDFAGTAAAPTGVAVRRGAGVNGSDRITLTWPDGAIRNTWLRVTVLANPSTGLASPDVFSFGNLVGDTGDAAAAPFRVNALDLAPVKRAMNSTSDINGRFDFNRDGRVNALDLAAVRGNLNRTLSVAAVASAQAVGVVAAPPRISTGTLFATKRAWDETESEVLPAWRADVWGEFGGKNPAR